VFAFNFMRFDRFLMIMLYDLVLHCILRFSFVGREGLCLSFMTSVSQANFIDVFVCFGRVR
jgi:hypothetical protein